MALPGLRDGFQLLRELQERFWDQFYPELEDGDAEFRTGPFDGLNAALPLVVRQVPLTQSGNGESYYTASLGRSESTGKSCAAKPEAYQAASLMERLPANNSTKQSRRRPDLFYETLFADLQQSIEECERLDRVSDEKFGRLAPSLVAIKKDPR